MDSLDTNIDWSVLLVLPNKIPPTDSAYVVIQLSDVASYKTFFHLFQMLIICNECRKNIKLR